MPIPQGKITALKQKVASWLTTLPLITSCQLPFRICIFDGFLIYTPEIKTVFPHIDVKLFLRVSHAKAKQRREARDGYVTLEGFWQDPPGYVDRVVWPNYAEAHAWLFVDGDVEGRLDEGVLDGEGIEALVGEGVDVEFGRCLEWAVERVMREVEKRVGVGVSG